jgi:hypothetical protein
MVRGPLARLVSRSLGEQRVALGYSYPLRQEGLVVLSWAKDRRREPPPGCRPSIANGLG